MISILKAEYFQHYQIRITFNSGQTAIADLESVIKNDHRKIVRELIDLSIFKSFHVELDTLVWSNGLDFAPEFLAELAGAKASFVIV